MKWVIGGKEEERNPERLQQIGKLGRVEKKKVRGRRDTHYKFEL